MSSLFCDFPRILYFCSLPYCDSFLHLCPRSYGPFLACISRRYPYYTYTHTFLHSLYPFSIRPALESIPLVRYLSLKAFVSVAISRLSIGWFVAVFGRAVIGNGPYHQLSIILSVVVVSSPVFQPGPSPSITLPTSSTLLQYLSFSLKCSSLSISGTVDSSITLALSSML